MQIYDICLFLQLAASRRKRQASIDCGNGPYAEQCEYDYAVTGNEEVQI